MISELGWSKVGMLSCPSTCSRCHGCCWRKWSRDTMTGRSTALFTSGGTSTVTDIRQNSCCVSVVLLAVSAPKPSEKLSEHTLKQWRHDFVRPVGRDAKQWHKLGGSGEFLRPPSASRRHRERFEQLLRSLGSSVPAASLASVTIHQLTKSKSPSNRQQSTCTSINKWIFDENSWAFSSSASKSPITFDS